MPFVFFITHIYKWRAILFSTSPQASSDLKCQNPIKKFWLRKRMATPKLSSHSRSISLPSSLHPLLVNVEELLQRLKSSEAASLPSHSLACRRLDCLKNLYECLKIYFSYIQVNNASPMKNLENVKKRYWMDLSACWIFVGQSEISIYRWSKWYRNLSHLCCGKDLEIWPMMPAHI